MLPLLGRPVGMRVIASGLAGVAAAGSSCSSSRRGFAAADNPAGSPSATARAPIGSNGNGGGGGASGAGDGGGRGKGGSGPPVVKKMSVLDLLHMYVGIYMCVNIYVQSSCFYAAAAAVAQHPKTYPHTPARIPTHRKRKGQRISMVTAYDYPSALHVDWAGIDVILVGDSVAMVELGYPTTQPVGVDQMVHHCQVNKGTNGDGGGEIGSWLRVWW